jgi:capsular polysaccharide biosynthesis protein
MAVEHGETIVAGPVNDGGFTITWALALVRRHTRLATVVFGAVFASAATFAISLPDMYRSTATVLVEHPGTAEGVGKSLIAVEIETRLQMISQEVLSQTRLMALVDRFDLYPELRMLGEDASAVERLRRDIQVRLARVEGGRRPVAFSIVFCGRHPETVARVANALASFYVEENAKILERQASSARLPRLTQELAQMQEVYTPQYPDVVRLKAEIAALKRLPRASLGEELRVLDPAIPARRPVAPERVRFILLGIGLGLGAAAAALLLADEFDGSIRTLEELRTGRLHRPPLWLTAVLIALGLVLIVFVSYHLASGNDQWAFLLSPKAL